MPVGTALIDGELVVEKDTGASDFSALQADLSEGRSDRFLFYAFDLLYLDGYDLTALPLIERKELARDSSSAAAAGIIRYSSHFEESGDVVFRHACQLSLEGVVSKLRDAPYRSGRSKSWVKSKCSAQQEFVIAGYVPSTTSRQAIGSLILGVYDGDKLVHVGRVGTGFTVPVAEELFRRLNRMRIQTSPFAKRLTADEARQARYVRPELVAEVEFRAWTADGHLRHASFRGLREDKAARDVVREKPKTAALPGPGAPHREAHPSRPALLARRGRDQGRARRLLHRGLAPHRPLHRRPSARAAALPERHHRREILPEARLEGHQSEGRAGPRSQGARRGTAHQHQ